MPAYVAKESEGIDVESYFVENVIIANTMVTNVLTAQKGYVADLTVDRFDSSDKVERYKLPAEDPLRKAPVGYIRIYDQHIDFIDAQYVGDVGGVEQREQAVNRKNEPLYWLDATMTGITETETAFPVWMFRYNELVKMSIHHRLNDITGFYEPVMVWGAGLGSVIDPERGKSIIYKDTDGLNIEYLTATGKTSIISISDFVDANHRRISECEIDRTNGVLTVLQEGEASGDETEISFVEGTGTITYTWPDSFTTTISIT
jgi:hypothetical protein